jgi:hypothetical protein
MNEPASFRTYARIKHYAIAASRWPTHAGISDSISGWDGFSGGY